MISPVRHIAAFADAEGWMQALTRGLIMVTPLVRYALGAAFGAVLVVYGGLPTAAVMPLALGIAAIGIAWLLGSLLWRRRMAQLFQRQLLEGEAARDFSVAITRHYALWLRKPQE